MITVDNKYEVGQRVWYLDSEDKAHEDEVEKVTMNQYKDHQVLYYTLKERQFSLFYEHELYPSKKDLMNHIFDHDLIEVV